MLLNPLKSLIAIATLAASLLTAGTASAQWTISRPGSYKLYHINDNTLASFT